MKRPLQASEQLLKRLEWSVLRRLDGVLLGDYRSLFRGTGLDLADIREYQPHDDVRHIDWNVTARQQTPYVRQYHEDREVSAWFLLDLSPSMDFGSNHKTKRQLLLEFFALVGKIFARQGNRVGAIIFSAGIDHVVQPGTGTRHLLHIIERISRQPEPEQAPQTDLSELLKRAMPICKRRCVMFVVSDFVSEPGWMKPLGMLSERHEVTAVRLLDPLETFLPDLGVVTMQDAETGEQLLVDTEDPGFRERFEAICKDQEDKLIESLTRAGVDVLELSTEDDLFQSMMRFVQMRRAISAPANLATPGASAPGSAPAKEAA